MGNESARIEALVYALRVALGCYAQTASDVAAIRASMRSNRMPAAKCPNAPEMCPRAACLSCAERGVKMDRQEIAKAAATLELEMRMRRARELNRKLNKNNPPILPAVRDA